jgi:hypothetical protein
VTVILEATHHRSWQTFLVYFQSEMEILQDKDLEQEVKLLKKLIDYEG